VQLHSDYSKRAVSRAVDSEWVPSPLKGVDRKMLERNGEEVARATTIVRYAAGSFFSPHVHTGGEEFIVLNGIFSDEHGDYGAGMYVRNPVGSKHKPFSKDGCTILVKLWQYPPDDQLFVRTDTNDESLWNGISGGAQILALHSTEHERVEMRRLPLKTSYEVDAAGGAEVFVYSGNVSLEGEHYSQGDWLRFPVGDKVTLAATTDAMIWMKTGHLLAPPPLPLP